MNTPLKIGQPRFLTTDEVLSLHRLSIDTYGGADGVLDDGKLDASLAMPKQGFSGEYAHEFPFGMAAAYGYHIAMNHAFRDGNKRTAFAAMVAFLRMAGWNFVMPDGDAAGLMLELIEQRRGKEWLADQIREMATLRPCLELRDFFASLRFDQFIESFQTGRPDSPGGRSAEFQSSMDELVHAIPAVHGLLSKNKLAAMLNDPVTVASTRDIILALHAIYRQAEDMGYEW